MLRRNPTRIELKMEDILEYHKQRMENAKAQQDFKKMMSTAGDLQKFVSDHKDQLKNTIDALQKNDPQPSS